MADHFNGLSPAEAERLALLIEEAAEVQQMACKVLRHGYDSWHPADPDKTSNRELLATEVGHLVWAIDAMGHAGDLDGKRIARAEREKAASVGRYLHHSRVYTVFQETSDEAE